MGFTVITPPTGDIVALGSVKLFLRVDGPSLDDEIRGYIRAAVAEIERMTSTLLAEQVVEIRTDCFADLAHLSIGPVSDIVSINYQDAAGVQQVLGSDSYELFGVGLQKGIRPVFGGNWPTPRSASGVITARLEVGYSADDLPATVQLALKQAVRSKFDGTPFDLCSALVNDRIWL